MVQQSRALTVLVEDPGSIPSACVVDRHHLYL